MEVLERQLAELELVSAAYPDEIETVGQDDDGNFSFHARLRVSPNSGELLLRISFPSGYPEMDHNLYADVVDSAGLGQETIRTIKARMDSFVKRAGEEGGEQAFQLLQAVEEQLRATDSSEREDTAPKVEPIQQSEPLTSITKEPPQQTADCETETPTAAERVVTMFRFDHIKAKFARKTIGQLAADRKLSGLCRPGKPGLVVVCGGEEAVRDFEREMRGLLSTCTRNMGCWGPANHHFQSISAVAHRVMPPASEGGEEGFVELETETVMHLAHAMRARGWLELFWEGTRLSSDFDIPDTPGGPDPYLRPRGGTKRKKGNGMIR